MHEVVDFSLLIDVVPCAAAIHTAMSCGRGERPYVVSCIYLSFIRGRCMYVYVTAHVRAPGDAVTPRSHLRLYVVCVGAGR